MALCYAGVDVVVREVALRDKPQALRAISPKATVPVLQLASGEVLDQSLDIMLWALRQSDPDGWLAAGDHAQGESWIALNDGPFKLLLDHYKYAQRHPELPLQAHRERALDALVYRLDARLRASAFLLGPTSSLADVALFPFVRQFALVDKPWFDAMPLPGLQRWLSGWLGCALFASVMDQHQATGGWVDGLTAPPEPAAAARHPCHVLRTAAGPQKLPDHRP